MTLTHCLPTGSLGTGEIPVCNIGPGSVTLYNPGGLRRGVVVWMHGLGEGVVGTPQIAPPANVPPSPPFGFSDYSFQLFTQLLADQWAMLYVNLPEDFSSQLGGGTGWIFEDVSNDPGHGSRYLAMTGHWWDHLVTWINENVAAGVPVVAWGGSGGGWHTLALANIRSSEMVGYMAYIPAAVFPCISSAFVPGFPYSSTDMRGLILGPSNLNSVHVPGLVSYGTNDFVVAWSGSTVAAASTGVPVSSFGGSGVLHVATTANYVFNGGISPSIYVTGLSGGIGEAIITFTGNTPGTPGTLTGCKTTFGSGTLVTGAPCYQNTVDAMITSGQAHGMPITRLATTDNHEFTQTTATSFYNWVVSNLDPLYPAAF